MKIRHQNKNGGRALIQLFNAEFSTICFFCTSTKEMKGKYIITSFEKLVIKICCVTFFKVV